MVGMIRNKILLEQGNNRILIWSLLLDCFKFEIEYRKGKENYLANFLTREAARKEIKMFSYSSTSTSSTPPPTPEGFQLVLLYKYFHMSYCFQCFIDRVKESPAYEYIHEKRVNSSHGNVSNIVRSLCY